MIVLVFIMYNYIYINILDDRIKVQSDFDGNVYIVRNTSQSKETANTLARLNKKIIDLIEKLEEFGNVEYQGMILRLKQRYNPKTLNESRIEPNLTSYTINKGESISLCVRTRDNNDHLYNDNILFGVLLHELAHVGSIQLDHGFEFVNNFNYLLKKATEFGVFKRINEPFDYCGIETTI